MRKMNEINKNIFPDWKLYLALPADWQSPAWPSPFSHPPVGGVDGCLDDGAWMSAL